MNEFASKAATEKELGANCSHENWERWQKRTNSGGLEMRSAFSFLDFAAGLVAVTPVKVFVVPPFGSLFMGLPSRAAVQSCCKEQPQEFAMNVKTHWEKLYQTKAPDAAS
jgi:hypothetical protein